MSATQNITIGKAVVETLTLGMYENPLIVYREYIQNATDQIDVLKKNNVDDAYSGTIDITIDAGSKQIIITDNATGIKSEEVESRLGNVASSTKDPNTSRGFRGIGRLGGLGYCDILIFETSFYGENTKSIMSWDAKKMKSRINDKNDDIDAAMLISESYTITSQPEDPENHYFTVKMLNVNHERLLDVDTVRKYLSMVSPVPFGTAFCALAGSIREKAKTVGLNLLENEYTIYVNNEKLYKGYRPTLTDKQTEYTRIIGVEFIEIKHENKLLAWGWYGLPDKYKAIPKDNFFRCIRLRHKNIQIGTDRQLERFFQEERGISYFIGELYALHEGLVPNARRDYFNPSDITQYFEKAIRLKFKELHKLYHDGSSVSAAQKKVEEFNKLSQEFELKRKNKEFIDDEHEKSHIEKLESAKEKAEEAKKKLEKLSESPSPISKIAKKQLSETTNIEMPSAESDMAKRRKKGNNFVTSHLSGLNGRERKVVTKIFQVINDNLTSGEADELIKKIIDAIK